MDLVYDDGMDFYKTYGNNDISERVAIENFVPA